LLYLSGVGDSLEASVDLHLFVIYLFYVHDVKRSVLSMSLVFIIMKTVIGYANFNFYSAAKMSQMVLLDTNSSRNESVCYYWLLFYLTYMCACMHAFPASASVYLSVTTSFRL
jgi:hypothetical protein